MFAANKQQQQKIFLLLFQFCKCLMGEYIVSPYRPYQTYTSIRPFLKMSFKKGLHPCFENVSHVVDHTNNFNTIISKSSLLLKSCLRGSYQLCFLPRPVHSLPCSHTLRLCLSTGNVIYYCEAMQPVLMIGNLANNLYYKNAWFLVSRPIRNLNNFQLGNP